MSQTREQMTLPSRVKTGTWLLQGWDWFVEDLGLELLIGVFATVLVALGNVILAGPVAAGLACVGLRKARGEAIELSHFFDGFRFFVTSLLCSLLIFAFTLVGLLFLIIPGLVILAMYQFTYHFLVDREMDVWQAMEESRKLVAADYFGFTILVVVLGLINFLAAFLTAGLACVLTLPVTALAITAGYVDFQREEAPPPTAEPVFIE